MLYVYHMLYIHISRFWTPLSALIRGKRGGDSGNDSFGPQRFHCSFDAPWTNIVTGDTHTHIWKRKLQNMTKTIFFNRIPSIPLGRIPQLFPKMQVPKIKMGSTKMQTSWSKSVPFMVESLEQTNFDSPLTLADVEFLPTQQTSPKRAKVPLLLCALQVAYFIISCCDLNHLSPPSLSTDGNNYRLQDFFSRCKPVFFLGGGRGGGGKFFLKICKKGNIPFFVPGSLWSYFPDAIRWVLLLHSRKLTYLQKIPLVGRWYVMRPRP